MEDGAVVEAVVNGETAEDVGPIIIIQIVKILTPARTKTKILPATKIKSLTRRARSIQIFHPMLAGPVLSIGRKAVELLTAPIL